MRQPRIYGSLQIFLHCLGGLGGLVGNGDGKAHIVGCPELLAPGHESLSGCPILADEFVQALNEHMGDVEIARMQAADEALQQGDVCDVIFFASMRRTR